MGDVVSPGHLQGWPRPGTSPGMAAPGEPTLQTVALPFIISPINPFISERTANTPEPAPTAQAPGPSMRGAARV